MSFARRLRRRLSTRLLHPVADAGYGHDAGSSSLAAGCGQLLAQVLDVDIDRPLVAGVCLALDPLEERGSGSPCVV